MIKFLLRQGGEAERKAIHDLLVRNNMQPDRNPADFLVAEIDGRIVGAARLEWEDQAAYVHPIVVDPKWRGKNVGMALMRQIAKNLPAVHVIARGEAVGFYSKLGFKPIDWGQVKDRYRQECESCDMLERCEPEPMIYTGKQDH